MPLYKIILLGTAGVGKSSLLSVSVNGDSGYQERRPTTLEAEFGSLDFSDNDTGGKGVRYVDVGVKTLPSVLTTLTATFCSCCLCTPADQGACVGHRGPGALPRNHASHYRRADGALLVYDMAEPESFDKLGEWLHALRETAGDSLTAITVVENKIDQVLPSQPRPRDTVALDQVRAFCEQQGLVFARATAKMNCEAESWEHGRKVLDIVKQLVLAVHDQRCTGARNGGNSVQAPRSPAGDATQGDGRLVLKDAPVTPRALSGDCGACGRS